jgi:methylthioribulose-1-phosphate dehydratase
MTETAKMNPADAKRQLVEVSHYAHSRGWVPATSGNFSARLPDGDIAVTVSGKHKGKLSADDIMRMGPDGIPRDDLKPSAETPLHLQLYARDNDINAVLHTHSVNAIVASRFHAGEVQFQGLEILKAFPGIESHESSIKIPIFDNSQNIVELAGTVERHMLVDGQGVGYLISGHGLYTWGSDMDSCLRHLEALEYLFDYDRLSRTDSGRSSDQ